MLIGPLLYDRLSVFQRNFVRAMGLLCHAAAAFKELEFEDNINAKDGEPRCGAYIIDRRNGDILHWIRFERAVRELFDGALNPWVRAPMCVGLGNPEMRTLITFDGEASG